MLAHIFNGKKRFYTGFGDPPTTAVGASALQSAINAAASALGMGDGLIPVTGAIDVNTAAAAIAVARAALSTIGPSVASVGLSAQIPGGTLPPSLLVSDFARMSPADSQQVTTVIAALQVDPAFSAQQFLYLAGIAQPGTTPTAQGIPTAQGSPTTSSMNTAATFVTGAAAGAGTVPAAAPVPLATKAKKWLWVGVGVVAAAAAVTTTALVVRHRRRSSYSY